MSNKIFISYNHNDKQLIDTIARRLELEFGRNNIFYDAWTMQPGDSIIGKMNEGLGDFTTFFFFVSSNSLQSKMVTLEWQTALNRAINEQLKFVAVRIAECTMPSILTDKIYIDLYGEGLDDAVEKMKLVAKGENTYKPLSDVENVVAEYSIECNNEMTITIRAEYYSVNNPEFAFAALNEYDDFSIISMSDGLTHYTRCELFCEGRPTLKANIVGLHRDLRPGFPFVARVKPNGVFLKEFTIYQLINAETREFRQITLTKAQEDSR